MRSSQDSYHNLFSNKNLSHDSAHWVDAQGSMTSSKKPQTGHNYDVIRKWTKKLSNFSTI